MILTGSMLCACIALTAQNNTNSVRMDNGVDVRAAKAERIGSNVRVSMDLDFRNVKVKTNHSLQVIPTLASETDTLMIAKLSVMGRNRMFYYLRNHLEPAVSENDKAWTRKDLPDTFHFSVTLPYEKWMNGARIMVNECVLGCCNKVLGDNWADTNVEYRIPEIPAFKPEFVYLRPKAEVHKMRELNAVSYVDFPVSKTNIYPEYRNNPVELKKILATIDSVSNDADITIRKIFLKGFASPESPYENNYRLAKGRTASIKEYVSKQGHVPAGIIETDFEPENWEGLAAYIEASNLENKKELLEIARDREMYPDRREAFLKKKFPVQYEFLKENCYPALRKVDYVIDYEVRVYTSVEEILAAFRKDPSKLSLEEFYVLALSYPEDSEDFRAVIRTAVTYYPKDQVANLNAANIAMMEGRLKDAGSYLDKAGESFEAIYAKGIYNAMLSRWENALDCFKTVRGNIPAADKAIDNINNILTITELLK